MDAKPETRSTLELLLEPESHLRLANLCGPQDANLRQIEGRLGVHIRNRGHQFQVVGEEADITRAAALLHLLYRQVDDAHPLSPEQVHLHLQQTAMDELVSGAASAQGAHDDNRTEVRTRRRVIKGRGENQRRYIDAIGTYDINFGIGPAGTGKTYLAVACAVRALEADSVARILLVRPAVEAGEKLGFLPGDLAQKIDPYLRPLYDALYELFGFEKVHKLIERNVIEVAPLAYMRGRTLSDSFIILDESQNTTVEQMKMFLTRIGFGSTAVITGDVTQVDLPRGVRSGLKHVINVLDGVPGISFTHFSSKDVVRHPLVQRIVEAYERAELAEDARHEAGRESRAAARAESVRAEAARIDDAQPAAVQGAQDAPSVQGAQDAPSVQGAQDAPSVQGAKDAPGP